MIRINSIDGQFHNGDPSTATKGTILTAAWLNAVQEEIIARGGNIITAAVETTLSEVNAVIFANPAEGTTVLFHLPTYANVGPLKRFKVKNIGQGIATLDAPDGKTIDGGATLDLAPGDRLEIAQDGTNWQTI